MAEESTNAYAPPTAQPRYATGKPGPLAGVGVLLRWAYVAVWRGMFLVLGSLVAFGIGGVPFGLLVLALGLAWGGWAVLQVLEMRRIAALLAAREHGEAERRVEQLLQARLVGRENRAWAAIVRAELLTARGAHEEALAEVGRTRALAYGTSSYEAQLSLIEAEVQAVLGRADEADAALAKVPRNGPDSLKQQLWVTALAVHFHRSRRTGIKRENLLAAADALDAAPSIGRTGALVGWALVDAGEQARGRALAARAVAEGGPERWSARLPRLWAWATETSAEHLLTEGAARRHRR